MLAVRKMIETRASAGAEKHLQSSTITASEESPLPKKGREKLASLLADLIGFPSSGRETKTNGLDLYESMSSAFGNELKSKPAGPRHDPNSPQDKVIYENCFKCQSEYCRPPPRVTPAGTHRAPTGQRSLDQAMPSGMHLKKSPEQEAANEDPRCQARGHGSRTADERRQFEEINDHAVISEGKGPPLLSLWRLSSL